ncbi:helix-turn-helix domain-containing protein [Paenibacillus sp. LMG 31456]|uniref:Helix-turn-helix domain-containing protein n=1 Tax=Paenibacillus foliorum TaxID=2654974 RepID=A0A972GT25_9BACL|nr:helix-turn-helix domain-containing protein [Paenibacillus foliorum]NOU96341.1 helix-turn-helix domain-containing protein [Paenibacillus foliorum]
MGKQTTDLPAEGILLYEFKHTDGDIIKEHDHHFYQVLYALEGEGKITLDGKVSAYTQDNVAVIAPNSKHSIMSNTKLTVLVLAFDGNSLDTSIQEALLQVFFNKSKLHRPNPFSVSELRQLFRKMLFEQASGNILSILVTRIMLSELLVVLVRSQQLQQSSDANGLRAERIRHYIDTHYFEILNCNDISAKQGISTRYLNNIFKKQFEMTPMQYLTDIRIKMAKTMLVESEKDIVSICFELGFESVSTFYRAFKDSLNMPPNKYRTIHKAQDAP